MLDQSTFKKIANQLQISEHQTQNTLKLLDEGATIPFIARYRKELTGSLDEVVIGAIRDLHTKITELEERRNVILDTIEKQGNLNPELKGKIEKAGTITELEDLYLPFKPKRKTRASIARERGLEPLAKIIIKQTDNNVEFCSKPFLSNEVPSIEDALQGARDIISEWISENVSARNICRNSFQNDAIITSKVSKGKEEDGAKYRDYFDFSEPLKRCPSHRLLAMRRGENEGFLKVKIEPGEDEVIDKLEHYFVKARNAAAEQVAFAVKDSYKRLLQPSIENEFAGGSKQKADDEAIRVFADNLRQLLMAPPLGSKKILAIDPGFRTGCKIVCLDKLGTLQVNETIYPHPPQNNTTGAAQTIHSLLKKHTIEAIAIGNGTAGRETEDFIKNLGLDKAIQIFMVNENGASIYSASAVAREEFGDYDVTVRGTISIGRRLMDPLSELVKIDPKSIGVGQYQHDVDQTNLQKKLDEVVISCVNQVGVDLNIASKHLLKYVSGLGSQIAENIVEYRTLNGAFRSREDLKKVARLGPKAYEQCAGFLRIRNAKNPLDNSAVHPESYGIIKKMASDMNCDVIDFLKTESLRKSIQINNYVTASIGLPTLNDIVQELAKPGRDPRDEAKAFSFDATIHTIDDLRTGMVLPGIVTNITNFGAFVDIGVKQDGLVHISHLSNRFISSPSEVVSLNQQVTVKVMEVDSIRKRIQLSMKDV
jgi:uncharacterized protein